MGERLADHLAPWILVPLLVPFTIYLVAALLPEGRGGYDQWSVKEVVLIALLAVFSAAAVGAGSFRLVAVARRDGHGKRDVIVFVAILLVFALASLATQERIFGVSMAAAFPLTGIALLALAVAALMRKSVDDVGILLPIYLFGIGYVYALVGLLAHAGYSGAFS